MKQNEQRNELRKLPAVDTLLNSEGLAPLIDAHGRVLVVTAIRDELESLRRRILAAETDAPDEAALTAAVAGRIARRVTPTLQPLINATGVIIHTNLGRALLSQRAQAAMVEAASAYNNLEYDLEAGVRGSRYHHAQELLCRLSGAEAALVVNNNAAALVLALSTLARGRSVLISRSQLIEIGGGFRIPDIMRQSGAELIEVGTTNRTYLRDYEARIDPETTGLLLRVHHSNYKIIGFTAEPSLAELVSLGRAHGLPVMDDLGSGTLLDTAPYGLEHEPTIQESIAAGVDLLTASGDKLLGGPQAGLVLGRAALIERIKEHPLTRAFRVDKLTLAALQATLLAYLEEKALAEIPVWQMISAKRETLADRANAWQAALAPASRPTAIIDAYSTVGGGSLPGQQLPTRALAIQAPSPDSLAAKLRAGRPRVVARIEAEQLLLDPRTVLPEQDEDLVAALRALFA